MTSVDSFSTIFPKILCFNFDQKPYKWSGPSMQKCIDGPSFRIQPIRSQHFVYKHSVRQQYQLQEMTVKGGIPGYSTTSFLYRELTTAALTLFSDENYIMILFLDYRIFTVDVLISNLLTKRDHYLLLFQMPWSYALSFNFQQCLYKYSWLAARCATNVLMTRPLGILF